MFGAYGGDHGMRRTCGKDAARCDECERLSASRRRVHGRMVSLEKTCRTRVALWPHECDGERHAEVRFVGSPLSPIPSAHAIHATRPTVDTSRVTAVYVFLCSVREVARCGLGEGHNMLRGRGRRLVCGRVTSQQKPCDGTRRRRRGCACV